jgi:hypothetical protein
VSPSAAPFEQMRPKFAGCSGSALIAKPLPSVGARSTRNPQPTPQ